MRGRARSWIERVRLRRRRGDQGAELARARRLGPPLQQPVHRAVPGRRALRAGGTAIDSPPWRRLAYPIALVLLLTDLLLLVLDLGDPLRFHHMLRVFKPYSPMSFGTWSLTLYSLPLTLIVAIDAARAIGLLPHDSAALEGVPQAGRWSPDSCRPWGR